MDRKQSEQSVGVTPNPRLHGKDPSAEAGVGGSYPLLCHLLDSAVVAEHLWQTRVRPKLRVKIAAILGVDVDAAGQVLMLIAAVHDLGKVNPFFQYQERLGQTAFAPALQESLGLPPTDPILRQRMTANFTHPLRRHEFVSHRAVAGQWPARSDKVRSQTWAGMVAGGHHGYWREPFVDGASASGDGEVLIGGWTEQQDALLSLIEGALDIQVDDIPALDGASAAVPFVCYSGLLTMADWIASDDSKVGDGKQLWTRLAGTPRDPYSSSDAARNWMDVRGAELRAHTDSALGPTASTTRESMTEAVMEGYRPRPLQQEALDITAEAEPGLWICMYPTGDGKTEAALLRGAVDSDEGFFFGLPTLATTDAMETRISEIADRISSTGHLPLIKSHQFASIMKSERTPTARDRSDDECCDQANPTWYTASIRKLVAPNVVGTVDQALFGALAQRHITLRLFGLANHHIILDEVHTYDAYQTELLIELLYWWGMTGTRVTLLSATLPISHMRCMVQSYAAGIDGAPFASLAGKVAALEPQFPSTASVSLDGTISHLPGPTDDTTRKPQPTIIEIPAGVSTRPARVASHIAWAKHTAATHSSSPIAIVSNVVADCTEIATALQADPDVTRTHEVICLHSSLAAEHRQRAEERLIDRAGRPAHVVGFGTERKPVIVVGTQVIQASLDFDVDFMASDLAPAPDLIQRLGRAWRFEGSADIRRFRGGRLPEGTERTLRVVAVFDENGVPTNKGAVPYLAAPLRRTYAAIAAQVSAEPLVDVFAFSQQWVDAAYDKDPYALLSEDQDELRSATMEIADEAKKKKAAGISKAALAMSGVAGSTPLLPAPRGMRNKGPMWRDLVSLTALPDDEDLMRTRYIEYESLAVILFDSTGESFYTDPATGLAVPFESTISASGLMCADVRDVAPLSARWRCVVPSALQGLASAAITQTTGGTEWIPKSKLIASTPPLDLKYLRDTAYYHPTTGLMKKDNR